MAMFGALSAFDPIDRKFITPQQPFTPAATPNPYNMTKAGGFFAPGGTGRAIAGSVGDALLQLGHMQPIYQPAMEAQREFAMRRQLAEQERQNTLGNETALYDYKLAHPDPGQMSDFDKQAVAGGYAPGTPEWVALHKQRVQELADPVVTTPQGMMLRSQALAQMAGQPAPPGVTFTPIDGGPTPSASGNFPNIARYYGGQ